MAAKLVFSGTLTKSDPKDNPVLIVGQLKFIKQIKFSDVSLKLEPRVNEETFTTAVDGLHPSPTDSCPLWLTNATVAALPVKCSRHNTPTRSHALSKMVKSCYAGGDEFIVIVCERKDLVASAAAVARTLPLYSRKSSASSTGRTVVVEFLLVGEGNDKPLDEDDIGCLNAVAEAVRLTAKIVDIPCADMHTNQFLNEIREVGEKLGIQPRIIAGEALDEMGLGGIWGVGKAAVNLPALAVLSFTPPSAEKTIAWVGKGIVFDTGGLCIKTKVGMCGMKTDCGGAAAMLGAFYVAVKMGFKENLHAVFCLAENAVGPKSLRPDDIITLYSGKTVEINNTDAEGRLVLGDGVAYAQKDLKADIIVDMATLTGAQGIATGKYHAGILTNNEDIELACVKAGQNCGDLVHPVPYSPELHFPEFNSSVADMKNSVADRSNAQVSCAGLFIGSHLGFDFSGVWLHIDMAAPAHIGDRATGYGPVLLNTLFGGKSSNKLLQLIAPPMPLWEREGMEVEENTDSSKKAKLQTE
ncbi:probable aminopeptidase NPEPL1 isoform X2 [Mercenaria mercenaria]|uniref:probable aminopeptidase NPEPL1 isoform X2 n=1 Tax=Mercenaria mercenaria TaxID=6596 RepID=UPI00234E571E|nr:probable aminopeptidase NPEPL1 isoform X2 [Mercenaria mercenaria]